jgi:hypothetical protein
MTKAAGTDEIMALLAADQEELYSVLGAAVLATSASPLELLQSGRAGRFYSTGPAVYGSGLFDHKGLKAVGQNFLIKWGAEIRKAVCGKSHLLAGERKEARQQVDVWIATLVATLSTHIPELGPFSVVLNILAVLMVRSGLSAFCAEILPPDAGAGPKARGKRKPVK